MLKRLNVGLFKSEEIGKYLKDKVGYVILYILFLSILAAIPLMIRLGITNSFDDDLKANIINKIQNSDFDKEIKDYTYDGESFGPIEINSFIFFGTKTTDINRLGAVFVLEEKKVDIYFAGQKSSTHTLEELDLKEIDFSLKERADREKLGKALDIVYKEYKTQVVFYNVFVEVLGNVIAVIFLSLMFVWIYSYYQPKLLMKYRFVITSYASTVYFFTLLLDGLFGVEFISFIGIFIMGFNLRKAYSRLVRITIVEKGKDQEENE